MDIYEFRGVKKIPDLIANDRSSLKLSSSFSSSSWGDPQGCTLLFLARICTQE